MSEGTETLADRVNGAVPPAGDEAAQPQRDRALGGALAFGAVAAVCAIVAFAIVRRTLARRPIDPTTERIQTLIEEANRLLRALDEKTGG
ncbi:MAG: hypothetical protein ACREM2_12275 [Vulcanimicrobiaceae bacterium]